MPRDVIVDTGPMVALFDRSDLHHERAVRYVAQSRSRLLTALPAVTEAMYLLDGSLRARRNLLSWIRDGGMTLVAPDAGDLDRVIQLLEKYSDVPMDFTDGMLVALCERLGVKHVATVDRDFSIYRFKRRSRFVNVFFDE